MNKIITIFVFAMLVSFQVFSQDTITTLQPIITLDTNAICVGSIIDVPFYSVGSFTAGNVYSAILSNSSGTFTSDTSVIGTFSSTMTYDPSLGSLPGNVEGNVPNVSDGCNYYIHVISNHPQCVGVVYGPICIQHCDILPNNGENIHLCLTPTTETIDTPINIQIHTWYNDQTYNSGNVFKAELLDTTNFFPVGAIGALGSVAATHDTTLMLIIPPLVTLQSMGISPGTYYLRIVATEDIYSDSAYSSLIGFTLGAPADNPPATLLFDYSTFTQLTSDTVCSSETIYFDPNPFNSNSNYIWSSGQMQNSPIDLQTMAVLFTGFTGDFIWTLQEINYGCPGPISSPDTLFITGPPNVNVTGPHYVCLGDTNYYYVPLASNTYYSWTSQHGEIIDSLNDSLEIRFDTLGTYDINILAINSCGSATAIKQIVVVSDPTAYIYDSIGLNNTVYFYDTILSASYSYLWNFGDGNTSTQDSAVHTYLNDSTYIVTLKVTNILCGGYVIDTLTVLITGMDEINNSYKVILSPNPNDGNFILSYSQLQTPNSEFVIKDVLGRTVYTHNIYSKEGNETIDVSDLSNGVYFYQLTNNKETVSGKFVKE